jgi:hypothetical protein
VRLLNSKKEKIRELQVRLGEAVEDSQETDNEGTAMDVDDTSSAGERQEDTEDEEEDVKVAKRKRPEAAGRSKGRGASKIDEDKKGGKARVRKEGAREAGGGVRRGRGTSRAAAMASLLEPLPGTYARVPSASHAACMVVIEFSDDCVSLREHYHQIIEPESLLDLVWLRVQGWWR